MSNKWSKVLTRGVGLFFGGVLVMLYAEDGPWTLVLRILCFSCTPKKQGFIRL